MNLTKNYTAQPPYTRGVQLQKNKFTALRFTSRLHKDVFKRTTTQNPSTAGLSFKKRVVLSSTLNISSDLMDWLRENERRSRILVPPLITLFNGGTLVISGVSGQTAKRTALTEIIDAIDAIDALSGKPDEQIRAARAELVRLRIRLSNKQKHSEQTRDPLEVDNGKGQSLRLSPKEMIRRLVADLHMTGNRVDVSGLSERQRTFLEQQAESYCTAVTNEERAAIRAATVEGLNGKGGNK